MRPWVLVAVAWTALWLGTEGVGRNADAARQLLINDAKARILAALGLKQAPVRSTASSNKALGEGKTKRQPLRWRVQPPQWEHYAKLWRSTKSADPTTNPYHWAFQQPFPQPS